jgi:hypothetical protein
VPVALWWVLGPTGRDQRTRALDTASLAPGNTVHVADADETGFLDVDAAVYTSLDRHDATLAHTWRQRFLESFFEASALSTERQGKANELLTVQRGVAPDGTVILRIEFGFMGSTEWHTWNGTPSSALAIADEVGNRQGCDVERDQAEGPTGWEPEFDDER